MTKIIRNEMAYGFANGLYVVWKPNGILFLSKHFDWGKRTPIFFVRARVWAPP